MRSAPTSLLALMPSLITVFLATVSGLSSSLHPIVYLPMYGMIVRLRSFSLLLGIPSNLHPYFALLTSWRRGCMS